MFSFGKFSRQRFSLGSAEMTVRVQGYFYAALHAAIGFGQNSSIFFAGQEALQGVATVTPGLPFAFYGAGTVGSTVEVHVGIPIVSEGKNQLKSVGYIGADFFFQGGFKGSLQSTGYIGSDIQMKERYEGALESAGFCGKDVYMEPALLFGAFFGQVMSAIIDSDVLVMQVDIPPGGVLELDSRYFTATVNDKNILHLHGGDWVFLREGAMQVVVSTGDGAVDGTMMYTEMHL